MKKAFKLISVIAAVALLVSVMAACSGSNGKNGNTGNANSAGSGKEAPKPVLKRLNVWANEDYNTYPVAGLLEEATGYKVQHDMLPQDKWVEKLNLIMSSGEEYDLVTSYSDMALYSDYAQKGALVDLTPLIEEFGPNIKTAIKPESIEALKVNGKLYAIPTTVTYKINSSILIRTDWLEKLGLQMPTTTEELKNVLQQFKEKDPGGNGDRNVPMTIKGDQAMIDNLVGAFGMPNAWNDVDGKLVPRVMDPAYKDYVAYVADLYKQGLIDREFVANKDATAKEKFSSGAAGAIVVHWADIPAIYDALTKNQPDAKFAYVPALKGPAGEFGFGANAGFDRLTFIPKSAEHPEDAIKWINASLEPETFKNLAIGVEGTHHKVVDGAYEPIQPIFTDERNLANNFMAGTDETNYPQYWQARVRKNPVMFEAFDYLNNKLPEDAKKENALGLAPYMKEYSKSNQQLHTMLNDYTVKLIAGVETIEGLPGFQQKFLEAGGEASSNEVNEWYATVQK
ncbi:extracellular solute-binding protein [Paenibacillus nanensis]|uniref:Extracellular solute-binding protein n=1 Tax=Paenibacillus nanensis TaxID=393251 RepID=A0A3A1VI73_9BACL|nr:extracellular solute-binding protein [Paenibacillus nanensis]RIX60197.1 extracellular solute-binding protein [Paenibacillus nanensis]